MTPEDIKAMRDRWCTGDCDIRMTFVQAGKDIGICLEALEEAETKKEASDKVLYEAGGRQSVLERRIAELEGELGPLRAFQRNHLPGGCIL